MQNYTIKNNSSKRSLPCIMETIEKLPTKFGRIVYPWKRAFLLVRRIMLFSYQLIYTSWLVTVD